MSEIPSLSYVKIIAALQRAGFVVVEKKEVISDCKRGLKTGL